MIDLVNDEVLEGVSIVIAKAWYKKNLLTEKEYESLKNFIYNQRKKTKS